MDSNESRITKIVITGGPCAGKTTAQSYLRQKLGDCGVRVVFVPEAATLLLQSGIRPAPEGLSNYDFQRNVLVTLLHLEKVCFKASGKMPGRTLLCCDRGVMDGLPYSDSRELFEKMISQSGLTLTQARDERYEAVIHLRSAAIGAEKFYTLANNTARRETLEEARVLDERTLEAWIGHPHLRVIENRGSFEQKMKDVLAAACKLLGIPEPIETERKYRVSPQFTISALGAYQEIDIEQFYLVSPDQSEELRLRRRMQWGESVYFETRKRPGPDPSSRIETERMITASKYESGRCLKVPGTRFVRKKRICFVYDNQYFELDCFQDPELSFCLLEVELVEPGQEVRLPPFLTIEADVTGRKEYGNRALAA